MVNFSRTFLFFLLASTSCLLASFQVSIAGPGDTIKVQTFTFGSPQEGWFVLPSDSIRFEKVFMKYKLKCNPAQNPACGEWDYLTYTFQYQPEVDSIPMTGVNYLENGLSPDSFSYLTSPQYQLFPYQQYFSVNTDTLSYFSGLLGTGGSTSSFPLHASTVISRTQYLWKASELTAAGITAGNITGLQFNILAAGGLLNDFSIRMKSSALDSLTDTEYESNGFVNVFDQNTSFPNAGWNSVPFTTPFNWDGSSNIVVEITLDNETIATDYSITADASIWKSSVNASGDDGSMHFNDANYVSVPPEAFAALDSAITVAFWYKGDPFLDNRTAFEAYDIYDHRVLNVHLPWSDQNIYWDAGTTLVGSYDRINKAATVSDYENNWHYWAFTKNVATGSMKIYEDGTLWHSGTGMVKPMNNIKKFWIGSALWDPTVSANANMDEFAVWNAELDSTTLKAYMYKDLDALHPFSNNLLVYYQFNDNNFFTVTDKSGHGFNGSVIGAQPQLFKAADLFRNFQNLTDRPQLKFEQGVYTSYEDSALLTDTAWLNPVSLVHFNDPLNPGLATDTQLVWTPYFKYLFDAQGNLYDSLFIAADTTIHKITTAYMSAPAPVLKRWELGRYITPYGIGLSLGDGWTWTYDVSDYVTLLHDSVFLTAGNWQELLDMQFIFIEGTPPRDPIKIQNLWNGDFWYGMTSDPIENHLVPLNVMIDPAAFNTRLKARVTGHGGGGNLNCAEFCARSHSWSVNGVTQFTKTVWRETCSVNPLYPQGGTWIYSRANWCPGSDVETYNFELTPFVTPGSEAILDYDTQPYTWNGGGNAPNYVIETQLVSYAAPNFSLDASVDDIITPNNSQVYSRQNPICNNPLIRIKNNGTTPLTSLKITYGIDGATPSTFDWTGNLGFLGTEDVQLGAIYQPSAGNSNKFTVTVSEPNGGADEYEYNNTATSYYKFPDQLSTSNFVVEVKTNNAAYETSYTLKDEFGNVVIDRDNLNGNTYYRDTLDLPNGCYIFHLDDSGEDGLSFFANSDGAGSARFKKTTGALMKSFTADFGKEVYYPFTVGFYMNNTEPLNTEASVNVYPNPSMGEFWVDILVPEREMVTVEILDVAGKEVFHKSYDDLLSNAMTIDLKDQPAGTYFLQVKMKEQVVTKKIMLTR